MNFLHICCIPLDRRGTAETNDVEAPENSKSSVVDSIPDCVVKLSKLSCNVSSAVFVEDVASLASFKAPERDPLGSICGGAS